MTRAGNLPRFRPCLEKLEDRMVLSPLMVVNDHDAGPGSLCQAILDANTNVGLDSIVFASTVHHITLTTGELKITDSLDLTGPGANQLSVSGNDASRVFNIQSGMVAITGLTITHGLAG